jgi:NAD(P)-dependent dehydrogenase (short-subunit alcohol dehydrogenase family)
MDTGLKGKTALITGGGSGIGRAIALALAHEGVHTAIASFQAEDEAVREIEALGVRAHHIMTDVSVEDQVVLMVEQATAFFGQLDLYVNNVATTRHQPITKITNCREVCKHMIGRRQGSILIVGSTAQYTQAYREAAYHISKTGLRVFKNTLALEMAPYGIRVNLLVPGHFPTKLTAGASEAVVQTMKGEIPLRRLGRTEELGPAAVLLLSDKLSPYTTGAELTVDGGLHLRPLPLWTDEEIEQMNQP